MRKLAIFAAAFMLLTHAEIVKDHPQKNEDAIAERNLNDILNNNLIQTLQSPAVNTDEQGRNLLHYGYHRFNRPRFNHYQGYQPHRSHHHHHHHHHHEKDNCWPTPCPDPPTPWPTPWPTPAPTPAPTPWPTAWPTLSPTMSPTIRPTLSPTASPLDGARRCICSVYADPSGTVSTENCCRERCFVELAQTAPRTCQIDEQTIPGTIAPLEVHWYKIHAEEGQYLFFEFCHNSAVEFTGAYPQFFWYVYDECDGFARCYAPGGCTVAGNLQCVPGVSPGNNAGFPFGPNHAECTQCSPASDKSLQMQVPILITGDYLVGFGGYANSFGNYNIKFTCSQ